MGVVFQAFDAALRRVVAVKFLSPRLAVSPLARARFTREAQAAAAINDPHVVTIHAIGEHEGLPYLVMEYVAGITLAARLKREGMLGVKSILRIGIQVARGLAAAHSQGLIHRDVKPENILLESGLDRAKITDFGLACVPADLWRLTASGVLLGTPAYMSPEQATGAAVDRRSDLFSLGSLLYHVCTGEPPFPGPSVMAILDRVRDAEPRPIRDLNPDIPPALASHIRRLMAKDPSDRFPSANEVVRTLADQLAEAQGRRPGHSIDDGDRDVRPAGTPEADGWGEAFQVLESGDEPGPRPPVKGDDATAPPAASNPSINPRALPVIRVTTAVAVATLAWILSLPSLWKDLGQEAPIILPLALAGLAVFTWVAVQIRGLFHPRGPGDSPRRGRVSLLRNALAIAILVPVAGTAYLELSAYAESRRAVNAVNARQARWMESPPPTRKVVEALIGRTADELSPGMVTKRFRAIYRWRGVFRSYGLHAEYMRLPYDPGDRLAKPDEGSTEFDVLCWISDVLE
jgi:hypothetical protein